MNLELTAQELFDLLLKRLEVAKRYDAAGCRVMTGQHLEEAKLVLEALQIRITPGS